MQRRCKLLFFLFLPFCFSQAQVHDSLENAGKQFPDSIAQIKTGDNPEKKFAVSEILIIGNKTTKPFIITRELIFHKGDSLDRAVLSAAMARSRENLLNTSLFNFVEIYDQPDANDSAATHVIVRVAERWYIWPLPIFEIVDRNFNEWWLTKDLTRTNYGVYLTKENFRGRKESIRLLLRLGYSQRLGLYYTIPYINRRQENGLSFGVSFTRNHEIAYGLFNNKLSYYKDENNFVRKQFATGVKVTHRQGIHDYHSLAAEYQDNSIADTIIYFNNDYFIPGEKEQSLLLLSYQYKRDYRDIKIYPLQGSYFDFEVVKQGLGILKNEPDLLLLTSNYRRYWKLSSRWHFAAGMKGRLSGQSFAPYYNSRGLGFGSDFVRGYEYYVVNGQNYILFKSNIKFTLVPEQVLKIKYIPLEKFNTIPYAFYLNVFSDMGYVRERQFFQNNPLANSYMYGVGIGLDYVTYYDLIFRMEYSFNKFGEHGIFLHFTSPIW